MIPPSRASAVMYAKNMSALKRFYQALLVVPDASMHVAADHVALDTNTFHLVLVAVPEHIAASIVIESPPKIRSDVPVKLVFDVESIAEARTLAPLHGGEVWPAEREWGFREFRVCDARDPEGNVIQLRQPLRS